MVRKHSVFYLKRLCDVLPPHDVLHGPRAFFKSSVSQKTLKILWLKISKFAPPFYSPC